ncbi:MAG: hypothetical protein OXG72_07470 [Acidobacteria bacterium]|nr:hypothetical protein [Acidobacteriota bacterium]
MPRTDTTTRPNRSRAMLLQPEDIVPRAADGEIAVIEHALRAIDAEERKNAQPHRPRR